MYYEIMKKTTKKIASGKMKPECIFCGKTFSWGDHFCLCAKHAEYYYKIHRLLRIILPKIIIKKIVMMEIGKKKKTTKYYIGHDYYGLPGYSMTKCPNCKQAMVGSYICKHECAHLIKHDEEKQIVECDVNYNKFKQKDNSNEQKM